MPKISALTSLAQASVDTAADVLPIVDATAPATTKKVTVQAMVNAGLATLTTLPSGIVNASLNSITPTGGTLGVSGSIRTSGPAEGLGVQNDYALVAFYTGAGTRGAYIQSTLTEMSFWNERNTPVLFAQNNTEYMRATGGNLLIGQTANPGSYKLAVTGNVGITGSISATGAGTFGVATNPTGAVLYARVASDQNFEVIAPGLSATGSRIFSRNNAGTLAPLELQASIVKLCDASGNLVLSSTAGGATVTGLTTTDTLRVNVTPTAETPTATHTAVFNINGTNYKFLCLAA